VTLRDGRNGKRRDLDEARDQIDEHQDKLIGRIEEES
jgi:hypothetical protein